MPSTSSVESSAADTMTFEAFTKLSVAEEGEQLLALAEAAMRTADSCNCSAGIAAQQGAVGRQGSA